jgi:CBS domain-containing protein
MVDCELKSVEKSAWEAAVIARNATIHDALECLDRSGLQICMVVDENSVLLGSLSDGDLRKHLLDGKTLSSSIDGIFNTDPLVARSDFSQGDILAMMIEHKIHQVPSVSSSGVVSGLFVWHKMLAPKSLDNYFLIMAGGRGTRLKPITETIELRTMDLVG